MNREKIGSITSFIGIIANIILACAKIIAGVIFGAISVLADGLNNLTDGFSNVVSLVSFKLSSKPADKEHPFGHERTEYILAMAISFVILLVAFELLKESILKIITPSLYEFSWLIIIVLSISILVKLLLFVLNYIISKKIQSDVLKATAIDALGDSVSTSVILLTVILSNYISINLDGYAGILVALIIALSGIRVLKETFSKLIGQAPSMEMIEDIKTKILSFDGVLGIHDLNVYCYGPSKYFASVHIEVDSKVDVMKSHELVDEIERELYRCSKIVLTGHLDPIEKDNPEVEKIKDIINSFIYEIDNNYSMHDFRVVKGPTFTNLIFDIAVPYENKITESEIIKLLQEKVDLLEEKYYLVVTIEHQTL